MDPVPPMSSVLFLIAIAMILPLGLPFWRWWTTLALGRKLDKHPVTFVLDLMLMLVYPLGFVANNAGMDSYGCCSNPAEFLAQSHLAILYAVFGIGGVGFLVQTLSREAFPPLLEFLLLSSQVVWFGFAGALLFQTQGISAFVIAPALLNVLWALWWRIDLLQDALLTTPGPKFPILLRVLGSTTLLGRLGKVVFVVSGGVLLLALYTGILFLFGQAPDAFARVFTDTYTHPLSSLVHVCNEECPGEGMYLCTIGDRGHAWVVGPTRQGWRQGKPIRCSRQLLVSNAFEASLARRLPLLQKWGRQGYDQLGKWFDPNRILFQKPWLSDLVHLAMLPAEGSFLLWLYLVEPKPERLIAEQYLPG